MWEKLMWDTVFQANFVNSFCTLRTLKIGCGGFILIPIKNLNRKNFKQKEMKILIMAKQMEVVVADYSDVFSFFI